VLRRRLSLVAGALALLAGLAGCGGQTTSGPVSSSAGSIPAGGEGSFVLTATNTGPTYAPTFTGNGELGIRVPSQGEGYSATPIATQAELAGFYAEPPGSVQQRADIPTWSTLTFSDGGQTFDLAHGSTSDWHQSIDLRSGVITTSARWTAPDGHATELTYQVLTDRADADVGLVRLTIIPSWTGGAVVTDAIDGTAATLSTQLGKGWEADAHTDWVDVEATGTTTSVAIASKLASTPPVTAAPSPVEQTADQSVGQQVALHLVAGHTYTFTKYVGVDTSSGTRDPVATATHQAAAAASTGFPALLQANDAAWAKLWSDRIDVSGDPILASNVNASEFYLWASTRADVDWSISPSGLSSNGYLGHVFWDAETWMYPALLAQHPDLAAEMDRYRATRLPAAEAHAAATGYDGARYPWESATDGTEQIPPPASLFSEGLYEQHITADVALAQWQYYLATGDKTWLAQEGWPVIKQAALFWASRVVVGDGNSEHLDSVTGPDEEHPDVNDDTYTNAAASSVLRDATQAAGVLGLTAPSDWSRIASSIVVPQDPALGIQPEFSGYDGSLVKQASVTMLLYPWDYPEASEVAENDIDYYAPRTDPNGPAMSDAVNSIDTAALGSPGCASFVFTERSEQPFIRDDFDQFSETRTGGVFTFMTGIGGFLQEFLYGYSGLRWSSTGVQLDPSLTGQLGGIVLHGLSWQGRRFTVAIGSRSTTITLNSGSSLPVDTPSGTHTVTLGNPLAIPTRRPDLTPTSNVVRCAKAVASSAEPGAPALAAVDGSPATGWQPVALPATFTVPLSGVRTITTATVRWGQQWPPQPDPTRPPPPGPVTTLRATSYSLMASNDGTHWQTLKTIVGKSNGTVDVLHFLPFRARDISVRITASSASSPPVLDELTVG